MLVRGARHCGETYGRSWSYQGIAEVQVYPRAEENLEWRRCALVEGGDWNWLGNDPGMRSWRQQTHTCPGQSSDHGHSTSPGRIGDAEHEELSRDWRSEYHQYKWNSKANCLGSGPSSVRRYCRCSGVQREGAGTQTSQTSLEAIWIW